MMMLMTMMMTPTSANVREYPAKRAAAVREIAPGSAVSCNRAFNIIVVVLMIILMIILIVVSMIILMFKIFRLQQGFHHHRRCFDDHFDDNV